MRAWQRFVRQPLSWKSAVSAIAARMHSAAGSASKSFSPSRGLKPIPPARYVSKTGSPSAVLFATKPRSLLWASQASAGRSAKAILSLRGRL